MAQFTSLVMITGLIIIAAAFFVVGQPDIEKCSEESVRNCSEIITNYTTAKNRTGYRMFPMDDPEEMNYMCRRLYYQYEACSSEIIRSCSSTSSRFVKMLDRILVYLCQNSSKPIMRSHGGCLMSQNMVNRLDRCNQTFRDQWKAHQQAQLSPSELIAARCQTGKEFMYCIRYQTWIECGQEASDFVLTLDKRIFNHSMIGHNCDPFDEAEPSGLAWSILIQTSGWWSRLVPQILRIQGDPEEWVPLAVRSANITRRTISGDYNKFRFGPVAVDYWNNRILWYNIARNSINYIPYWFAGSASTTTVFSAISGKVDGIATDWVAQNVYWTDSGHKWIAMASYKAQAIGRHMIVIQGDLISPAGIIAYPERGYLFWSDRGRHVIERSRLDGQNRTKIATLSSSSNPVALAMDSVTDTLFVLDNGTGSIESYSLNGTKLKRHVEYNTNDYKIVQIDVYKDYIFAAQETGKMLVFSKSTSAELGKISLDENGAPKESYGVAVFAPDKQKPVDNPCFHNNGDCDQLCTPREAGNHSSARVCACTLGFVLQPDGKTCGSRALDDNFLVIADSVGRDIYMLDLVTADIHSVPINTSSVPFALAFDPLNRTIFWLDGGTNKLHRSSLDGQLQETLYSFGSARLFELSYDWLTQRLFFSDTQYQRIAIIDMRKPMLYARTVLYSPEPTDMALDIQHRVIYWSDWREGRAKIARAHMDYGNDTHDVITTGLLLPAGLAIDVNASLLFWCDAYHGKVEQADTDGQNRRTLVDKSPGAAFFSIAVDWDFLYITDLNNRTLRRLNRTSNELSVFGPPEFQKAIAIRLVNVDLDGHLVTPRPTLPPTYPLHTTTTTTPISHTTSAAHHTTTSLPKTTPHSTTTRTSSSKTANPSTPSSITRGSTTTTTSTTTSTTLTSTTPTTTVSATPKPTVVSTTASTTPTTKHRTKPTTSPTTSPTTTTSTTTASTTPTTTTTPTTPSKTKPSTPSTSSTPSTKPSTPPPMPSTQPTPTRKIRTKPSKPSTTVTPTPRMVASQQGQGGLSGGATAGVVIVVLVVVAAGLVATFFILRRRGIDPIAKLRENNPFKRFESDATPSEDTAVNINDQVPLGLNESSA